MNPVYKFSPESFYPFKPFYFENQTTQGMYPVIITDYILVDGFIFPIEKPYREITPYESNGHEQEFNKIIVYRAFLTSFCEVDSIKLDFFLEERLHEAENKVALLKRIKEIMHYGLRHIKNTSTALESEWAFWSILSRFGLEFKAEEGINWVNREEGIKTKSISNKPGRTKKPDRTFLQLFKNKEENVKRFKQILELKGFTKNGQFTGSYPNKGIIRDVIKVLKKDLEWILNKVSSDEIGRIFNREFGVIMAVRNYRYGKDYDDYREEVLEWFRPFIIKSNNK